MPDRFFLEKLPPAQGVARLSGAEAHHLIHVLRAKPGLRVTLFDGSGVEGEAIVEEVGRRDLDLRMISRVACDRESPWNLTLGVALPKGDRQRWLVEKLVELGVRRLVPLQTERGVSQPNEGSLDRLGKYVIEASKQCGRNRLMEVTPPVDWPRFIAAAPAGSRWVAHLEGRENPRELLAQDGNSTAEWTCAVGPEGGFDEREIELAREKGWRLVGLGPRVLRVETAAVALASLVTLAASRAD